jgi:hypothetical protein
VHPRKHPKPQVYIEPLTDEHLGKLASAVMVRNPSIYSKLKEVHKIDKHWVLAQGLMERPAT